MDLTIFAAFLLVVIATYYYLISKPLRVTKAKWYTKTYITQGTTIGEVRLIVQGTSKYPTLHVIYDNKKIKDITIKEYNLFRDDIALHRISKPGIRTAKKYKATIVATHKGKEEAIELESPLLRF